MSASWQWVKANPDAAARRMRDLERQNTELRSIAAAMAEEMEQHGGELAFDSLARYRAQMGKEAQP